METKIRRSLRGMSAAFGAIALGLANDAFGQTGAEQSVSLNNVQGIDSWAQMSDGSLQINTVNGQTMQLAAGQFSVVNGQVMVSQSMLQALGLSAGVAAASGGLGISTGLLAGGGLAAGGGVFAVASGGGSNSDGGGGEDNSAPRFTSGASASVEEGTSLAYQATATDSDGDTIRYSLSGTDAALFNIDASSGRVTFKSAPDYDNPSDDGRDNVYNVIVTASDGKVSTNRTVSITVKEVSDSGGGGNTNHAPQITSGASSDVLEGATLAYQAAASDSDGDSITYSISGKDAALFTINSTTGLVSFKSPPDFDAPDDDGANNVYDIIVTASDGSLSTQRAVAITVNEEGSNVNNAPTFTSEASFSINENLQAVGTVSATDIDGDTITYSIASGLDGSKFTINSSSGELTFISAPDFEAPTDSNADNVYQVIVTASDGTSSTNQTIDVEVLDQSENAAPVFDTPDVIYVPEGKRDAFTLEATDADGDTLQYSIPSGPDSTAFGVFADTGKVTFSTSPDYENPDDANADGTYEITIQVTDGTNVTSKDITVILTDEPDQLARVFDVKDLFPASGYVVVGPTEDGRMGDSVSIAGDVNGDGYDDYIIGSMNANDAAGAAYVVFGDADPLGELDAAGRRVFSISDLDTAHGFLIQPVAGNGQLGRSVSGVGDINGDGYDDIIVGASSVNTLQGEAYVIFGSASPIGNTVGSQQVVDAATLPAATGFVIQGDNDYDSLGSTASAAGDFNGDGIDDLIVSASAGDDGGENAGEAYIIFGSTSGFGQDVDGRQVIDVTNLTPSEGVIIQGAVKGDTLGTSSAIGDINNDGYDDIIVGAQNNDDFDTSAGAAYVIFGRAGSPGAVDATSRQVLSAANLSSGDGFIIYGEFGGDKFGRSVSGGADLNGDGYNDIVVSTTSNDVGGDNAGMVYVIYGSATGFGSSNGQGSNVVDLSTLQSSEGFIIQGADNGNSTGRALSMAGDLNGDGYGDLLIGSRTTAGQGRAYVIFGSADGIGSDDGNGRQLLDLASMGEDAGFIIATSNDQDFLSDAVSAGGDINGDGYDDLIIAATGNDEGVSEGGAVYIFYGAADLGPYAPQSSLTLTGTSDGDRLIGGNSDDTISGEGGADVVYGGAGHDTLSVGDLDFIRIDGGSGRDSINFDAVSGNIDLTTLLGERLQSVEIIDLSGSNNNSLTVNAHNVMSIGTEFINGKHALFVTGDSGDSLIADGFSAAGTYSDGGVTYNQYESGNTILLVDQDINTSTSASLPSTPAPAASLQLDVLSLDEAEDLNSPTASTVAMAELISQISVVPQNTVYSVDSSANLGLEDVGSLLPDGAVDAHHTDNLVT
ncbi:hypothetical protein GRI39_14220 [Altererythrobacter indicus]|uniref:Cadherin domain-containing protein n=1 Tax=Altericroceibacterium indicum TaxID=374177 RepID=A0A845ADY3_9SPHN|nr:cadherin domain-containing protein [Altericroceibacterium indicum]MXP27181.1 hypothetical protein [Altericroceibacterium indicum]